MNADLLKTLFCMNINKRNQTTPKKRKKKSVKSEEHVYQCETRKSPISYHKPCTKFSYYTRNGKRTHFAEERMHSSSKWGNSGNPHLLQAGAGRTSWVPSLCPMLEIKSSRPPLGDVPGLSSTLAQGRNTKGPKSNHHFYTPGNGSSKDSVKGEKWRNSPTHTF